MISFSHFAAQAIVPEHLVPYVTAVGQSRPVRCGECVAFDHGRQRTLIAFAPGRGPEEPPDRRVMDDAVAVALKDCDSLTVLGPDRPLAAPQNAAGRADEFVFLHLPMPEPGQNLRNMLRRGQRECRVTEEAWNGEHAVLVRQYLDTRPLEAGTRHIFSRIPDYLAACPDATLFAARNSEGSLLAMTIGDFSSLTTAFYLFAFRQPDCPPGVADVLLHALVAKAESLGHQLVNLGLGINQGIARFKTKWSPLRSMPCVQTSWTPGESAVATRSKSGDPLAVYARSGFRDRLRHLVRGREKPFDCLQIEVTSQCPGKCGYCPHTTKRPVWRSRQMSDETFAALHPLVRRAGRIHLQGWGEPLLHPRFFAFAEAARRAGCAVSTTTYGLSMDAGRAAKIVEAGLDIVAFSLAGTDEASNAARAGVPFSGVREGVAALNRARGIAGSEYPHLHLAYLLLASRVDDVRKLPDLMDEWDVPVAVVSTLDFIPEAGLTAEAYAPGERNKIDRARDLLHAAAGTAAAQGRTIHYSLPGPVARADCNERIGSCLYIDAEGNIAPCIYVNLPTDEEDPLRRVFGSAHGGDPLAVWNDPAYVRFRRRLRDGDPDAPCVSCPKRFERVY